MEKATGRYGDEVLAFSKPKSFSCRGQFVNEFFQINEGNPVTRYLTFSDKFRAFAQSRVSWLPDLRAVDGGLSWCDNKLWDKMCYGLGTLGKLSGARRC